MESGGLPMSLLFALFQCSNVRALSQPNKDLTSASMLKLLQSERASFGNCSIYMSSQLTVSQTVFEGLGELSSGVSLFEHDFIAAQNASFLRKYWKTSFCTVLLATKGNASSSMDLLHRVVARNKMIVVFAEEYSENDTLMEVINSKIWSFDMVIVTSGSVRVICQGVGNIANIAAKHLSDCSKLVLPTLSRSHIQISAAARKPYILTSGGRVRGPDIEIIRLLERKFGFQYSLKREANFGIDRWPNGTTFGMMDSMGKRESELCMGEILTNLERHKYADFSTPMYFSDIVFATPKPKTVSAFLAIFQPLDRVTWAALVVTLLVVMLLLLLIDRLYFGQNTTHAYRFYDISIAYSMLLQYQAPHTWFNFRSFHSRTLLLCFWLLATFFISSGYRSVLLAKLTFVEHEKAIDSPQDILQSGLSVIIPNQTAPQLFMVNSVQPIIQKIYKESCLAKNGLVPFNGTYPAWVNKILDEQRAILVDDVLSIDQSKHHIASTKVGGQNTHVLYPLNSKLAPLVDRVLRQIKAMGLLQKFLSDFTPSTSSSLRIDAGGYASPITVEHFIPVIMLELLGVVFAILVFAILEVPQRRAEEELLQVKSEQQMSHIVQWGLENLS